jgi:drug/metabolite transporter (DMT)-like permease
MSSLTGQLFALGTACCWTITVLSFESAGKRVGSLAVNLIRLCLGFLFLGSYSLLTRGMFLPLDASSYTWFWLAVSGLAGFVAGDGFLFRAFVLIGARLSMLVYAAVPAITALLGWIIMGETLSRANLLGMVLTMTGIGLVVLERGSKRENAVQSRPLLGFLFAFLGACGQAVGLVLSKYGMGSYDAFAATQIRAIAGIVGFSILFVPLKAWPRVWHAVHERSAMKRISLGAFFGPFLGVSFSLLAVQHTATGIAATIMSMVPVLVIPPAVLLFKEKVTAKEIVGAMVAVVGVSWMFLM